MIMTIQILIKYLRNRVCIFCVYDLPVSHQFCTSIRANSLRAGAEATVEYAITCVMTNDCTRESGTACIRLDVWDLSQQDMRVFHCPNSFGQYVTTVCIRVSSTYDWSDSHHMYKTSWSSNISITTYLTIITCWFSQITSVSPDIKIIDPTVFHTTEGSSHHTVVLLISTSSVCSSCD